MEKLGRSGYNQTVYEVASVNLARRPSGLAGSKHDMEWGGHAMSFPVSTIVDLFCGAGGLSLGLSRAGFRPICAIDHLAAAVQTYAHNLGDHVRVEEITETTRIPTADVIAGGPPCQGFSSAGLRRTGDARNSLVSVFAAIVAREKPNAFIFENVEGFLTTEDGNRVLDLLRPLIAAGYRIHLRKLNAANYGVPQHRKRVIAIGGLRWNPPFPAPSHAAFGAPGAALGGGRELPRATTLFEAICDLPPPSVNGDVPAITDHSYRLLSADDDKRARLLKPGKRMRDLPEQYWHDSYRRRAYRRVMDGTPTERRGGAPAGLRRLQGDEPCKAITSGARSEFLHPTAHRNLTLRECARIQTFPDSFQFLGSASERALLIGNAVPPRLAEVLGEILLNALQQGASAPSYDEGALLSFVPTLSEGMSPALANTADKVCRAFSIAPREKQLSLWA
jgi:DNA (cytosine-5)-methyltransferase 1